MGHIMDSLGGPMHNLAYHDGLTGAVMTQFSLNPLVEAVGERPCPVSRADLQSQMIDWWGREKVQLASVLKNLNRVKPA